ncbi:MAG: Diedel [Proteobacteria bacterium]|nr:Diedel [Pseudomonadota bacterium]
MKRLLMLASLFLALAMANVSVQADCCPGGLCDDGSDSSTCCGIGKCNVFCCNCDKGCRKQKPGNCKDVCQQKYSKCARGCADACSDSESCRIMCTNQCAKEKDQCDKGCNNASTTGGCLGGDIHSFNKFNAHDLDRDGHLSVGEVATMLKTNSQDSNVKKEFKALDKNGDGRISLGEAGIKLPPNLLEKFRMRK